MGSEPQCVGTWPASLAKGASVGGGLNRIARGRGTDGFPPRALVGRDLEIVLARTGCGCRGSRTTVPGTGARSAWAGRARFTTRASPGMITTASSQDVQRSLPPRCARS